MKKNIFYLPIIVGIMITVFAVGASSLPSIPEIPKVTIRFSNSPYVDHSYSVIGVKKGFFEDVGITMDPAPYGRVVPANK